MDTVRMDPLLIVGCEGVWGLLIMGAIILPIAQYMPGTPGMGLHEDTLDTFVMLKQTPHLRLSVYLQMLTLAFYNIFGGWVLAKTVGQGHGWPV